MTTKREREKAAQKIAWRLDRRHGRGELALSLDGVRVVDSPADADRLALERVYDYTERAFMRAGFDDTSKVTAGLVLDVLACLLQGEREERAERVRDACDHKFIDSVSCLKCGWRPLVVDAPLDSRA